MHVRSYEPIFLKEILLRRTHSISSVQDVGMDSQYVIHNSQFWINLDLVYRV